MAKRTNVPQHFNVKRKKRKGIPGESPGTFIVKENALKSVITVFAFDTEFLDEIKTESIVDVLLFVDKYPKRTIWIDIQGLGSQEVLNSIQKNYNINPLVLEDIVNTHQRPKYEEYKNYIFLVSRILELDINLNLINEQLSLIANKNTLISIQEDYSDITEPVKNRLRLKKGGIMRTSSPSYLLYSLMDTVVDHYFDVINKLADELEIIEDELYVRPKKAMMFRIQGVKKILLSLRRAAWAEREKLNELLINDSEIIDKEVKLYLRDAYDHSNQIIDLAETYRDTSTTLMDIYLSLMNNKMNEVMKILTVISAIFIPLTFIVGVYGMNFAYQDPVTGNIYKNNMPELYMPNGYIYVWLLMILIALVQLIYFLKKGWFKE